MIAPQNPDSHLYLLANPRSYLLMGAGNDRTFGRSDHGWDDPTNWNH